MIEILRSTIRNTLDKHEGETDERGEVKSCRCGMLFGIQHPKNPTHERHVEEVLAEAIVADGWMLPLPEMSKEQARRIRASNPPMLRVDSGEVASPSGRGSEAEKNAKVPRPYSGIEFQVPQQCAGQIREHSWTNNWSLSGRVYCDRCGVYK